MLEFDPEDPGTDDLTAVTRCNYIYTTLETPGPTVYPGTPNDVAFGPRME